MMQKITEKVNCKDGAQLFRIFKFLFAHVVLSCNANAGACMRLWAHAPMYVCVKGTLGELCMEEYVCSEYLMSYFSNPYIHPSPPTSMPAAPPPSLNAFILWSFRNLQALHLQL